MSGGVAGYSSKRLPMRRVGGSRAGPPSHGLDVAAQRPGEVHEVVSVRSRLRRHDRDQTACSIRRCATAIACGAAPRHRRHPRHGRQLVDLGASLGDLACFDVVVAENGAMLDFPASGRHVGLAHPPSPAFLTELRSRQVDFTIGECVVETDASAARSSCMSSGRSNCR